MIIISLIRSVSCNSSMSKCNKTDDETDEYGPNGDGGPPLIDSLFVKQQSGGQNQGGECPPPPPPPNGTLSCSNPDLVQVMDHPYLYYVDLSSTPLHNVYPNFARLGLITSFCNNKCNCTNWLLLSEDFCILNTPVFSMTKHALHLVLSSQMRPNRL